MWVRTEVTYSSKVLYTEYTSTKGIRALHIMRVLYSLYNHPTHLSYGRQTVLMKLGCRGTLGYFPETLGGSSPSSSPGFYARYDFSVPPPPPTSLRQLSPNCNCVASLVLGWVCREHSPCSRALLTVL